MTIHLQSFYLLQHLWRKWKDGKSYQIFTVLYFHGFCIIAISCSPTENRDSAGLTNNDQHSADIIEADKTKQLEAKLNALIEEFQTGAQELRLSIAANERLCLALHKLRVNCPLLSPLIAEIKKPVSCHTTKPQDKVLFLLEAQFTGNITENMTLQLNTSNDIYEATITPTPSDSSQELDIKRQDGSRNSKSRVMDITSITIQGRPFSNCRGNQCSAHLALTILSPDAIFPHPDVSTALQAAPYDTKGIYQYSSTQIQATKEEWRKNPDCNPDIQKILAHTSS